MSRKYLLGGVIKPIKVATIKDVRSNGTAGGTATSGSFLKRTLNTLSDPDNIGIALASDRFTLPPGKYFLIGSMEIIGQTNGLKHKIVRDPGGTPSDEILFVNDNIGTPGEGATPSGSGIIDVTSSVDFELQYRVAITKTTTGLGLAQSFGVDEIYVNLLILKLR